MPLQKDLISPCGMNCAICMGYLREKNRCFGCRAVNKYVKTRDNCIIKNCDQLKKNKWKFCSDKCKKYPCQRLKSLDKRYRKRYGMSMIDNLEYIEKYGIKKFLTKEQRRWKCKKCGGTICVHRGFCYDCGTKK